MTDLSEERCTKCGICCYVSLYGENNQLFYTPFHCPHLDAKTKLCTVYDCRFELVPGELTVTEGLRLRHMPNGCPYADEPRYKGPEADYTKSPRVLRIVNEILRKGPSRIERGQCYYIYCGREMCLDQDWRPETTTYQLPALTELL